MISLAYAGDTSGTPSVAAAPQNFSVEDEVRVTVASGGRIAGSLSFTARSGGGSGPDLLTVDDGTFDLSPVDGQDAGSVLCMGRRAAGSSCG